jgi:UDP-N-acetyl-D-mannosaminuronic acid dehydrogenase
MLDTPKMHLHDAAKVARVPDPAFRKLAVIGLGYIGLPTAAVFADAGLDVVGVDVNPAAVNSINAGQPHIVEPNLDRLLKSVVEKKNLRASLKAEEADAFIVAVPTPFKDDHVPDLKFIEAAARDIAASLRPGNLVILESTIPVGATEKMAAWLAEERPDLTFPQHVGETSDIRIAHCPERVLPGRILVEVIENDRVVGGMTRRCAERAADLYKTVIRGNCHITEARTAEMAKLTENAFRDVNIAFANELSLICDKMEIDVWDLIKMANLHPRVNILQPGPGVGGHCIAVDPWFIVDSAPKESRLIRTAREVNDGKPDWVINKVLDAVTECGGRPTIACLGLAFKPNVDDLRESPALAITEKLGLLGAGNVVAVEPHIEALPADLTQANVTLADFDDAIEQADIVLLLVDHAQFLKVERSALDGKVVIDTRGAW